MGFLLSKNCVGPLCLDDFVPHLKVRFREDRLQLGGRSFPYGDVSKFVLRGGAYMPLIAAGEGKDGDLVLDLAPFLSIGVTEALIVVEKNRVNLLKGMLQALTSERLFESVEDAMNFAGREPDFSDCLEWSIRASYMRHDFPMVRKIVSLMNVARRANPRFYFEQFFDLMKIAYTTGCIWLDKSMEHLDVVSAEAVPVGELGRLLQSAPSLDGLARKFGIAGKPPVARDGSLLTGALSYESAGGAKRTVTDGRGLGVYVFLSFLYHVYSAFGDFRGENRGVCKEKSLEVINRELDACIGNDAVGKWLRTGKEPSPPLAEVPDEAKEIAGMALQTLFDVRRTATDGAGNLSTRAAEDNAAMFQRATGLPGLSKDSLSFSDCFYTNSESRLAAVLYSVCIQDEYPILNPNGEFMDMVNRYIEEKEGGEGDKTKAILLAGELEEAREELKRKGKELEDLREGLEREKKRTWELSFRLENQKRSASKEREELERLRALFPGECQASGSGEEFPAQGVALEEMVEFLRDFKITIVGGHFDTERRLVKMGLTSITYITDEQAASGNPWEADFICICATFVSHKIVRAVEAQFQDKKKETMYFNGTNAEKLVRSLYDFVKKWMEG